jgi:hypothetical protein
VGPGSARPRRREPAAGIDRARPSQTTRPLHHHMRAAAAEAVSVGKWVRRTRRPASGSPRILRLIGRRASRPETRCSTAATPTRRGSMRSSRCAPVPWRRSTHRLVAICSRSSSTSTPKARGPTTAPHSPTRCSNVSRVTGTNRPLWTTEGLPINLGWSHRIVPARTRLVVEDRDQICRHPSCVANAHLQAHHIVHWINGGMTDTSNLRCLCNLCRHRAGDVRPPATGYRRCSSGT